MFQISFASIVASVVLFSLVSTTPALAQVLPPEVEWERTFGEGEGYYFQGHSVQQTSDGGYIVAGVVYAFGAGQEDVSRDVYLLKIDALGNRVWHNWYGGASTDRGFSVQQTFDTNDNPTGYIVAGYTYSFGAGESDIYLVKTDSQGNLIWQQAYGGASWDEGYSVRQTTDGGYIVAGYTYSFGAGESDVYLVKTDSQGNLIWQQAYGEEGGDTGSSAQQTTDGGYIVAGGTSSFGDGSLIYLIKTDANGNVTPGWPKILGVGDEAAASVRQTTDGGYIVAGATSSFGDGHFDVYLVKTDSQGKQVWHNWYGGADHDWAFSVQQTTDGGYIVAGGTSSFGAGNWDVYLVKTDSQGKQVWHNWYGGANDDSGNSVQQTTDGGYIVAGQTLPFAFGSEDVYLIKLKPDQPPPPQRIQLNIFDPAENRWLPLTEQVRKDLFKPALPVVVIVHGWNSDLLDILPSYTNDLAAVFAARLPDKVNILAWDWLQEAKGKATQPNDLILGPNPSALHVWDQSKKLARALQRLFQADPITKFEQPVHLMGHSNGAFLVALTAIVLQSPLFGNGVYPVANVTLWDPPDAIRNSLDNNVPYLRRVHGTTVDCYSGTFNFRSYFSNVWYVVLGDPLSPGHGHNTYRWYQDHASLATQPILHRRILCDDPPLLSTIGFGASRTHASLASQLLFSCQPDELDVSLAADSFRCSDNRQVVYAQYCISGALTFTPVITARVDNGIGNRYCICELPRDLHLRMQLRRPAGAGVGAGADPDPDPLEATYTLPQTIAEEFDSVSFTYRIEAAPAPATFTLSIQDGNEVVPLFLATSDTDLGAGDQDSTTLNITPYHGKEVQLIFSLSSTEPGAIVEVSDLTMWQGPFHDNVAPVANAGADQAVAATGATTPITLDGSGSHDPDGDELTYVWALDDSAIATDPTPTVELPLGVHQITLHARDPFDGFSSDSVIVEVEYPFIRGDSNTDGQVDIADPIVTLWWLFVDSLTPICMDAADLDDGGVVNISDAVAALNYLFQDSAAPKPPFPDVGLDPTPDDLGCTLQQH